MAVDPKKTVEQLFAARSGEQAFRNLEKLLQQAEKGATDALTAVVRYMRSGRFDHVREHAAAELAELADEGDAQLANAFRDGLGDDATRYWCLDGYVKSAGRDPYEHVVVIALDKAVETEHRAQAIKCLAVHSGQPFDRGLPEDPAEWTPHDLRIDELRAWAKKGYQEGGGYEPPKRHPALDRPRSRFEKAVAELEKRLASLRNDHQDLANPSNWLTPAEPTDLKAIKNQWKTLPEHYLDFLTRFSPLNVGIPVDDGELAREIRLLGASELIDGQTGYATDKRGKPLARWPKGHVVIATADADPYVLDLSESDGKDAPVLTAMHGTGKWKFERLADSFEEFVRSLSHPGR